MSETNLDAALIAGLAGQAGALATDARQLAEELHTRGQELKDVADGLRRYQRFVVGIVVAFFVIICGLAVIAAINLQNGSRIRSCTDPEGECSKRGAAQTELVLTRLVLGFCAGVYADSPTKAEACGVAAMSALRGDQ